MIAAISALFSGGVVWGTTRTKLKHHDERLQEVEQDVKELKRDVVPALARLEGKMDIIVHQVVKEEA